MDPTAHPLLSAEHIAKYRLKRWRGFVYQHSLTSITHLATLQHDIDRLKQNGQLSSNATYQSYIEKKQFKIPDDFPSVKTLIIMAVFTPPAFIEFQFNGLTQTHIIPPQYYYNSLSTHKIEEMIRETRLIDKSSKLVRATQIHLKLAAVRSGLGKYGKNNICYVPGMGSYITLLGYFTDQAFPISELEPLETMGTCSTCSICEQSCPNALIGKENFVIDVDKCITLYNEIPGEFPEWADSTVNNALMGCWRCQGRCPGNASVRPYFLKFEGLSDLETTMVLNGQISPLFLERISNKLRMFTPETAEASLPVIRRNLGALLYK